MDTTVTINNITSKKLDKLCKANGCTKKDFLLATVDYFEKYGINPLKHESPSQEMQKLIKRIDQVIRFQRHFENEILRPMCSAIIKSDERIKLNLDNILSKQDMKPISDKMQYILSDLLDNKNQVDHLNLSQEQGFKLLARLIDAKDKTTILTDLSKVYSQK